MQLDPGHDQASSFFQAYLQFTPASASSVLSTKHLLPNAQYQYHSNYYWIETYLQFFLSDSLPQGTSRFPVLRYTS